MYSKNDLGIKDIDQVMHVEAGPGLAVRYSIKIHRLKAQGKAWMH